MLPRAPIVLAPDSMRAAFVLQQHVSGPPHTWGCCHPPSARNTLCIAGASLARLHQLLEGVACLHQLLEGWDGRGKSSSQAHWGPSMRYVTNLKCFAEPPPRLGLNRGAMSNPGLSLKRRIRLGSVKTLEVFSLEPENSVGNLRAGLYASTLIKTA